MLPQSVSWPSLEVNTKYFYMPSMSLGTRLMICFVRSRNRITLAYLLAVHSTHNLPHLRCGHDTFGCDGDEDCLGGLECVGEGTERKCMDIEECTDPR